MTKNNAQTINPPSSSQKKLWRLAFQHRFEMILCDETLLCDAINQRGTIKVYGNNEEIKNISIDKQHVLTDFNDIKQALLLFDQQNSEIVIPFTCESDLHRAKKHLKDCGYTITDIAKLKISDIIKYEAAFIATEFYVFKQCGMDITYTKLIHQAKDNPESILDDKHQLTALFNSDSKKLIDKYNEYNKAKDKLEKTLSTQTIDTNLKPFAKSILIEVEKARQTRAIPIKALTNTLTLTTTTLTQPTPDNALKCVTQADALTKYPKGRLLGGLLLGVAGAALIAASIPIALISFGTLSPISVLGITLGASLIVGGATIASGSMGLGAALGGSLFFFKAAQKKPLAPALTTFAREVTSHTQLP